MNAPKNSPIQVEQAQNDLSRRFNGTQNDEIDLLDILSCLVRKRNLILSVTIIFTLLSAGYALSITPMYKATIGFLMPQEVLPANGLLTKNTTQHQNIIKETKKSLYQKFLMTIQSYNFQREVFDQGNFLDKFVDDPNGSVKSDSVVLEINKSISLAGVPSNKTELFNQPLFLEMNGSKPEAMADYFNALVKAGIKTIPIEEPLSNAIDQRLKKISSDKTSLLSQENKKLEQQLLQDTEKLERQFLQDTEKLEQQFLNKKKYYDNKIELLTKELTLSRSLNIEGNNFQSEQPLNGAPRWYLYGAKILEEELKLLKSEANNIDVIEREKLSDGINRVKISYDIKKTKLNDDIRIERSKLSDKIKRGSLNANPNLVKFNKELKEWETFKTLKSLDVVIIDQPSIPSTQPISNKKAIIILAGLFLGLFCGCVTAFFQEGVRSLKARQNHTSNLNQKTNSFVFEHSSQTGS
jgi:LPS O-antigen subunit length determinant protein (WzzB/FepE family)